MAQSVGAGYWANGNLMLLKTQQYRRNTTFYSAVVAFSEYDLPVFLN
jgi:hypothetical protein